MSSEIDDTLGAKFGDIVSTDLFAALAEGLNTLIDTTRCGEIITFLQVPTKTPPLDPSIWMLCDGSPITDARSPMRGDSTPNLSGRFLVGAVAPGSCGVVGGSSAVSFHHDHGGLTDTIQPGPQNVDSSSGAYEARIHNHELAFDLGTVSIEPFHYRLLHYIKIR